MRFKIIYQSTKGIFLIPDSVNFLHVNRKTLHLFSLSRQAVARNSYLFICLEATPQHANLFVLLTTCL